MAWRRVVRRWKRYSVVVLERRRVRRRARRTVDWVCHLTWLGERVVCWVVVVVAEG